MTEQEQIEELKRRVSYLESIVDVVETRVSNVLGALYNISAATSGISAYPSITKSCGKCGVDTIGSPTYQCTYSKEECPSGCGMQVVEPPSIVYKDAAKFS